MPSALSVSFASLTGLAVVAALVSTRKGMSRAYPVSKAVASMGFIGVALDPDGGKDHDRCGAGAWSAIDG